MFSSRGKVSQLGQVNQACLVPPSIHYLAVIISRISEPLAALYPPLKTIFNAFKCCGGHLGGMHG